MAIRGALAGVALSALLVVGCGGSSSKSTPLTDTNATATTGAAASDAQFVSSLNSICTSSNAKIAALPKPTSTAPAGLGPFLQAAVPIGQSELTQAQALQAPAGKEATWKQALANLQSSISALQDAANAAAAGDAAKLDAAMKQADTLSTQGDQLTSALGASACANNAGSTGSTGGSGATG